MVSSQQKLIAEILHAGRALALSRDGLVAGHAMTGAKCRLLRTIHHLPVAFAVSAVARAMDVSRQTVFPMVKELVDEGLLEVVPNDRDRRVSLVTLTSLGHARLEELLRLEARWIADLTRGFDARMLAQAAWLLRLIRERASP